MDKTATSRVKVRYQGIATSLRRGAYYTLTVEEIRERRYFTADKYEIFVRRIGGNNSVTFHYMNVHDFIADFQILKVVERTGESGIKSISEKVPEKTRATL